MRRPFESLFDYLRDFDYHKHCRLHLPIPTPHTGRHPTTTNNEPHGPHRQASVRVDRLFHHHVVHPRECVVVVVKDVFGHRPGFILHHPGVGGLGVCVDIVANCGLDMHNIMLALLHHLLQRLSLGQPGVH